MTIVQLLSKQRDWGKSQARQAVLDGQVRIAHEVCLDPTRAVDRFCTVHLDGSVFQAGSPAVHLMLHKPTGYLSATSDAIHPTVLDLVNLDCKESLHLAGRLDRASSGLVLLTNDGRWSKRITTSGGIPKTYIVDTAEPIHPTAIAAFRQGFHFHTEDIVTLPAEMEILSERQARVTLWEGRYHQLKRMFHRVSNRVTALHRISIGKLPLPPDLGPGAWRHLTPSEISAIIENPISPPSHAV